MRITLALLLVFSFFSACVVKPVSDDLKKARAGNAALQKEAFQNARQVQIGTLQFSVALVKGSYSHILEKPGQSGIPISKREAGFGYINKPYALVELIEPRSASYTPSQVEAAARSATGCRAKFAAGVLAFVGGGTSATLDLQELRKKVKSSVRGWRADLTC